MDNHDTFYQQLRKDFYGENSSKKISDLYDDINNLNLKFNREAEKAVNLEKLIKTMKTLQSYNDKQQEEQLQQMEFKTKQLVYINKLNDDLKNEKNVLLKQLSIKSSELDFANKHLQQANTNLDEFTSMASHDLKSPLRAINHLTDWILADKDNSLTVDSKKNLALITQRSLRLSNLIDSLLNYSRVGKEDYLPYEIDLNKALPECFSLLDNPSSAQLKTSKLPTIQAPASVIESIFSNLFSNSIKYGGVKNCQITVSSTSADGFIYFSIHDNGKGIDANYFDKIFDPFVSLQSKDEAEGSGLGLAHSLKLSRHFGGDLYLDSSTPESGTTFIFKWPVQK